MQIITSLTNYPNQMHRLVLENNETADFHLYYSARMQSWYFDITYKNWTINGVKIVLSPNILRQFRKVIPFGLSFMTNSYVEPFEVECFTSGRVEMGILNAEEVKQVEADYYND